MKAGLFSILLLTLGAVGAGLSCQGGETQKLEPPAAKERATATTGKSSRAAANPGKLIFGDDFSNPGSGWERNRDRDGDYIADYMDGEYQIKNAVDHQVTHGMFESREVSDGDFSVTVRKLSGPDDVRFGLVARYADEDSLEAAILPDGRCLLWMRHYEQHALKTKPDFKPCPPVRGGNEANQLRLVVSGAQATFYVNGEKVAEAGNISREGRRFGLFANSTSTGSDVRFDNFELHEIP